MPRLWILGLGCLCTVGCFGPSGRVARSGDAGAPDAGHDSGPPRCGNQVVDEGEQCDGLAFPPGGQTCADITGGAAPNGILLCDPATCTPDTSMCAGPDGTAGSGAFAPCNDGLQICDAPTRAEVCNALIACDTVPGPELTAQRCQGEINVPCLDCMEPQLDVDSDSGVIDCDPRCADFCGLLAEPPETPTDCMDVFAPFGHPVEQDACFCGACLPQIHDCVADDTCWFVVQCALRTGCKDMGCLTPETCQSAVDLVGLASSGVMSALALGSCRSACLQ